MSAVLNIAAYKFVSFDDREALREAWLAQARERGLLGTILLAPEGVNLFLAGDEGGVRGFLALLRADPRLADLEVKESWSAQQPFRKMLVRLKGEIIRMDHPMIRPEDGSAPAVDAATLARWLDAGHDDEGRPLVLLDTRNGFEVDHGAFEGALDWRLSKFTEFPQRLREHRAELEGHTVVSYCTGGIRCEKAALLMREEGMDHVYQLDGGILKYFETVGGRHYQGRCFVFDEREALDQHLAP
ncbi:sulfurtransferase [Solimonas sp. K1W22B-7]|uniref:sulfurtransferase n=1 Tax=Solimonas sp. K1W22B-7 TaxID=2303331 RepID=UPI000E335F44|nr:sulfurtransferase [Solimonas sp. K1W22B-7]AXQ31251.1 sulfurtransferase [Solimonas sp. K1W22B-7]